MPGATPSPPSGTPFPRYQDLRLGLSLWLISPPTAVAVRPRLNRIHAGRASSDGPDDVGSVRGLLRAVDPEDAELFPPDSLRKWTYL